MCPELLGKHGLTERGCNGFIHQALHCNSTYQDVKLHSSDVQQILRTVERQLEETARA